MTQKEEIKVPYAITAYVARNKDNTLWLCYEKPSKNEYEGYWEPSADIATYIDSRFFPCVRWEDKEPLEIEVSAYFPCRKNDITCTLQTKFCKTLQNYAKNCKNLHKNLHI